MTKQEWLDQQEKDADQAHDRKRMMGKVVEIQGIRIYNISSKKRSPIQNCNSFGGVLR